MRPDRRNMVGQTFGRLTVDAELSERDGCGAIMYACSCDCGATASVAGISLRSGHTKSCGCLYSETRKSICRTHGKSRTNNLTYNSWLRMRRRCSGAAFKDQAHYSGRGISVCERWNSFSNFLADMGARPPGTTLDRIDNDGNYEPGNCRWASNAEQSRNTSRNVWIEHNGKRLCLKDWADEIGVSPATLHSRYRRGWSHEEIITGRRHPMTKLDENAVAEIRSSTEARKVLAERFGVTVRTIYQIRSAETWRHV